MGNWPALLLAPALALANLAITYALTTPACSRQSQLWPNVVTAVILLACLWITLQAWRNWTVQGGGARDEPEDARADRPRFIALVATMVGTLSCLALAMQWFPQWILSPCQS